MAKSMARYAALFTAILISTVMCAFFSIDAGAVTYTEKTITVDYDGQTVDSFYGVDAKYITTYSDVGEYSCAGYVSRFYSELFGVTVYNINTQDAKPDVYCWGKDVELREVSTPRAGDIMQDKDYTHVAIVKSCVGDEVTVIEQNYKWASTVNDEKVIYTVVNRKLIKDRHYYYRLYIDGVEQSLTGTAEAADTTKPVISNMKTSSVSSSGCTVSASVTDNKAVSKIKVTVSTKNGSDTITKTYSNPSSNFSYSLKTADLGKRDDTYVITFTAYDAAGNSASKSVSKYIDTTAPSISSAKASDINAKGFTASAKVIDTSGISKVTFEVWTVKNSTDDKKTYTPALSGTSASLNVLVKNHKNETGAYKIKINVTDKFGNTASKTFETSVNPATSVKLSTSSISVAKGSSKTVTATMTGSNVTDSITWKSSDTSIATVSNGKITGKSLGTATVTATTTGGKKASCTVKVTTPISGAIVSTISDKAYTGNAQKPSVTVTLGGKTLVNGTDYTVSYSDNTAVGKASVKITGKGYYTGTKTVGFNIVPNKVSGLKESKALANSMRITWSAAKGAGGYEVYRYNSSSAKWVKIASTASTSYNCTGLNSAQVYKFKVRAYRTVNGKTYYGAYTTQLVTKTIPAQATCKASSSKSDSMTITWEKLDGVSGYEIFVSETGKTGSYTRLATVKDKTSYTAGGVGSTCLRFVKVRGYYVLNGKKVLGDFSPVVMVMIK